MECKSDAMANNSPQGVHNLTRTSVKKSFLYYCVIVFSLTTISSGFAAFSFDFATSDECTFCHTSGFGALVDSKGKDLSIADDWAPTMMANSFRDPFFRAKFESEIVRNPQLAGAIEDKCLTCHAPMARTQAKLNGARSYSLAAAKESELAQDGVSCTLCHQIENDTLGSTSSFSGNYAIGNERKIYGPYKEVFPNPMLNHVAYLPTFGNQVDKPELCATCHTLFTPVVAEDGRITGTFPEQTPYLEWLNSSYASAENYQSCQDCHMPKIDEPVKITNRPPWFEETQSPFWKHHFLGGNTLVLGIMGENLDDLDSPVPQDLFLKTLERTRKRLSIEAAELQIIEVERTNGLLVISVRVANNTGHKFPTGFPSRRAWISLGVTDANGKAVFTSGDYTADGRIVGLEGDYEPHHHTINSPGQVQIYQAIMGDRSGKRTNTLLRASSFIKDNRIPPTGYRNSGPQAQFTAIKGMARSDVNFNIFDEQEGAGEDIITYEIALDKVRFPLTIEAELLYQTGSPRFMDNLFKDDTAAVLRFQEMYLKTNRGPVIIDSTSYTLTQ